MFSDGWVAARVVTAAVGFRSSLAVIDAAKPCSVFCVPAAHGSQVKANRHTCGELSLGASAQLTVGEVLFNAVQVPPDLAVPLIYALLLELVIRWAGGVRILRQVDTFAFRLFLLVTLTQVLTNVVGCLVDVVGNQRVAPLARGRLAGGRSTFTP